MFEKVRLIKNFPKRIFIYRFYLEMFLVKFVYWYPLKSFVKGVCVILHHKELMLLQRFISGCKEHFSKNKWGESK